MPPRRRSSPEFVPSSSIPQLPSGGVPAHLRPNAPLKPVIPVDEPQNYITKPIYVAEHMSMTRKTKTSPTFKALKIFDETAPTMTTSPVRTYEGREKAKGFKTDPTHIIPPSIMPPVLQLPSSTKEKERFAREGSKKKDEPYERTPVQEFKKGGKVKKTGMAKVHKGELVVAAHRVASVERAVKKAGLKPLKK